MSVPQSFPAELEQPCRVPNHELVALIAAGGAGKVYLSRHAGNMGLSRLYAIKVLHPQLAVDEESVSMLFDEARLASSLHHPNAVPVLEVGYAEATPYLVMDYIEGSSLARLLAVRPRQYDAAIVATILVDCLNGLHAAHTLRGQDGLPLNLVHRDVSPQNILVGTDGVARITDFGIAKAEGRSTVTRAGLRKGKLGFMSPEQLADPDRVDARSDVFAAGIVLWSALTGEHLFHADHPGAVMQRLLHMPVPAPSLVGLRPPPAFDAICAKALSRNPDDRYRNAAEFAQALRHVAMSVGCFASSERVGEWVQATAGRELEERRKAVFRAAQRASQRDPDTQRQIVTEVGLHPSRARVSGLHPAVERPERFGKRVWLTILAAALGIATANVAWLLYSGGATQTAKLGVNATKPAPEPPTFPLLMPKALAPTPQQAEPKVEQHVAADTAQAEAKNTALAPPAVSADGKVKGAPNGAIASGKAFKMRKKLHDGEPTQEPAALPIIPESESAVAPKSSTQPASGVVFEANPYLRQE